MAICYCICKDVIVNVEVELKFYFSPTNRNTAIIIGYFNCQKEEKFNALDGD